MSVNTFLGISLFADVKQVYTGKIVCTPYENLQVISRFQVRLLVSYEC